MGVVCLSAVSLDRIGLSMAATPPDRLAWMVASGVFNLIGFLLISKGLQLTALVHANVINASQVAFGAVAGILLFREASNLWLIAGIGLTVAGIIHIGRPGRRARSWRQSESPETGSEEPFSGEKAARDAGNKRRWQYPRGSSGAPSREDE